MAANNEIRNGMTFDEVLANGQNLNLYGSLTWKGVDQIEFDMRKGTVSDFNTIYEQIVASNPGAAQDNAVDSLCSILDEWSKKVDATILGDLAAQEAQRQSADTMTLASQLEPADGFESAPEFLQLIVNDEHKSIFSSSVENN